MKSLLAIIFLAAVLFGAWWFFLRKDKHETQPKQEAIKINKHSNEFNKSIADAISNYLNMKNAFVNTDTLQIKQHGQKFIVTIDSLKLNELRKDDSQILLAVQQEVSDIRANAEAMLQENDLTEMRQDFRMVSENLYPFLKTIGYEGQKLYWQNCPMAFGENKEGNWLSNTLEISNPYLGKNHPEYKSTMLGCGETKDSLK
ncbi:MAG: DUF3347 domain-containing protein [Ginsengibacter sp.]